MDPAVFKAAMARFIQETYKGSAEAAAGIVESLSPSIPHYGGLNADSLGQQLGQVTGLLTAMQTNPAGAQLMEAVLQRLQAGMDKLPAELLHDLVVVASDQGLGKAAGGGRQIGRTARPDHPGSQDHAASAASPRRYGR
jgi:hypothetical protein